MPEALERWARLRHRLWQPPRPHGEQPLERAVSPLELFYDLVVVVLVGQTAHHLSGHLNWRGLAEFAAVFTLIWIVWLNGSLYHDLHGREDARGRTVLLVQILAMVPLGAFILEAGGSGGFAFSVSAAVLFAVLALVWRLAGRGTTAEYRRSGLVFVAGTAACAVLLASTASLPADGCLAVWLLLDLVYLVGFGVMIGTATPGLTVTPALIERFGLFTIIVLGETVLGVVDGLAHEPANALTIAVGLVAVVIGFGAWWTYFDFVGHRPPRPTRAATVQWILAHLPLTAAVTAMGASMPGLVEHAHDGRTAAPVAWLLCVATVVALGAAMALAASLDAWRDDRAFYHSVARTCAIVGVLCLALAFVRPAPLPLGLALVVLLGMPWGVAVIRQTANDAVRE
ncbi:low temperature requirement protein A [Streptomyces sp. NBC_00038]|uniref:low temperature requirement protein A n=1 Tax=Streptomyces sp. NBC_00038 TaxID=2903615 RepID=UPI00225533E0|nr:low temperature requirement protein A [Streptomyces sp. NBC_00038]MCX5562409.1 low temperature requirement protein A [Streptomyces sp. NBC_00038]